MHVCHRCLYHMFFFWHYATSAEYRLAYMHSNSGSFGWMTNVAAIYMAIERLYLEGHLGNGINISIVMNGNACTTPSQLMGAFEYLHDVENIDGFLGSGCSNTLKYAGYLATYWNLPILSQSAISSTLADKSLYPTLIRLRPPHNKLGRAMKEIIPYFNWTRLFIVHSSYILCKYAADAIVEEIADANVTVSGHVNYGRILEDAAINQTLASIKRKARIIFLCGKDEDEIRFMARAHEWGMTSSEYVYLSHGLKGLKKPWLNRGIENRVAIQHAMQSLIQIAISALEDSELEEFHSEHTKRMAGPPWFVNHSRPSVRAATLYDSMYLYGLALNASLENGEDGRDGRQLIERGIKAKFKGMSGYVQFDQHGDREPTYSLYCLKPGSDTLTLFAQVDLGMKTSQKFVLLDPHIWRTRDGLPPADTPLCGFYGEACAQQDESSKHVVISVVVIFILVISVTGLAYWIWTHHRLERELQKMLWRISFNELDMLPVTQFESKMTWGHLRISRCKSSIRSRTSSKDVTGSSSQQTRGHKYFTKVAFYRGQIVSVKTVDIPVLNLSRKNKVEIKEIRDLNHENINTFLGVCTDVPNACVVTSYGARGSLQDILQNDDIALDNVFKESFMFDIIKGMRYLHRSAVGSHGNLKSSNCIVDNLWVLKITDINLSWLQRVQANVVGEHAMYQGMLWTAPELLRNYSFPRGTREGDVYSFAIIMQEILFRALPFFINDTGRSPKDTVRCIKLSNLTESRPKCPTTSDVNGGMLGLMQSCWSETPANRPPFSGIAKVIQGLTSRKSLNIVDSMMHKLEVYSTNLEMMVSDRVTKLLDEKKITESLLHQMLPKGVAAQLTKGQVVRPEYVDDVTIYFSEIDDFLLLSMENPATQIIHFLNTLYEMFDNLVKTYDVYKVESIGDAYMVVSGLPNRNGQKHVTEIADMALDILSSSLDACMNNLLKRKLKLRIGIHTGPCCADTLPTLQWKNPVLVMPSPSLAKLNPRFACFWDRSIPALSESEFPESYTGVVGISMPRYCLFGDSVNTASRMKTSGQALRIHISQSTYLRLCDADDDYVMSLRGNTDIKGKGIMTTYWLEGKLGFTRPLPEIPVNI